MSRTANATDPARMSEVIELEKRDAAFERAIMRVLRQANGAKLTSREIYKAMGFDPDAPENWNRVCSIIWWLEKLISIHRIETDQRGTDKLYFITPPKDDLDVAA